jgi:catechol 2,3-dioxygenase-like lactoylglutathione lyase family enzyme
MIDGAHVVIYSTDADADRAFFRDVLEYPAVDAGGGWLIFALPPAEVAFHPTDGASSHELYFMCDDIEQTMADLRAKGVDFDGDIVNAGFGRLASLLLPGGGKVGIYEPRHPRAN